MRTLYTTKLINRPETKFYLVLDYTLPSTWPKSIQNDSGSLGLVISLKTRSRLSHLIKRESLMFSLRQYCLDFPIFTMIDSKFHFSPTYIFLEHMTSSNLVKCNSMIISIVMLSYPNVTLFLCYISVHWTTARTLNMKIDHKFPIPDNIKHNPKKHVSHL